MSAFNFARVKTVTEQTEVTRTPLYVPAEVHDKNS